jgi:hypothetical protein
MRTWLLFVSVVCLTLVPSKPVVASDHDEAVVAVQEAFASRDVARIAELVRFPLPRPYPLHAVADAGDLRERFQVIFDDSFVARIAESDPANDWSTMGWRGFMFGRGELWLDDDGFIIAVTYSSDDEQFERRAAIEALMQGFHPSVRDIAEPILDWETESFRVRVDRLNSGELRYAAWPISRPTSEEPSLILVNGTHIPDGSGGNHRYEFRNGEYRYICAVIVIGTDRSPPGVLRVYSGDELLLDERVLRLR